MVGRRGTGEGAGAQERGGRCAQMPTCSVEACAFGRCTYSLFSGEALHFMSERADRLSASVSVPHRSPHKCRVPGSLVMIEDLYMEPRS